MIKMVMQVTIPEALFRDWLKHVGSFNKANTECRFEILTESPSLTVEEVSEMFKDSGLTVAQIIMNDK